MTKNISAELSGALRYCGDTQGERIELPDLWEFYLDSCLALDADLQITESWRSIAPREIQIDEREQMVPIIGSFTYELGLDYRAVGTDERWRTLEIVAPERVSDSEALGRAVASFYGSPRRVFLSFDPTDYEFRLWCVGSTQADREEVTEASVLPGGETYAPLRKLLTAHKALAHCGYDDTTHDRLERVILRELAIWQPRWDRFKNKPLKREGSRRPGFKRTQGRRSSPLLTRARY